MANPVRLSTDPRSNSWHGHYQKQYFLQLIVRRGPLQTLALMVYHDQLYEESETTVQPPPTLSLDDDLGGLSSHGRSRCEPRHTLDCTGYHQFVFRPATHPKPQYRCRIRSCIISSSGPHDHGPQLPCGIRWAAGGDGFSYSSFRTSHRALGPVF